MKHMLGLDCGNSSYRIFLGAYDGQTIQMELIDQQPNAMIQVGDRYYWDILAIYEGFKRALRKASETQPIDSIGVCTWGVDFSLLTREGQLLGYPLSYRNAIGADFLNRLDQAQQAELFVQTGILCDRINSVYMLQGIRETMPSLYAAADKLLMIPDILNYLLTGVMQNEPSELSTTQLMDVHTAQISEEACRTFSISPTLFSQVGTHGKCIGMLSQSIREELNLEQEIPVICVPSHDTACAVLAVPAKEKDFAFISSGTWSLIGTELAAPQVTPEALQSGLTNEMGAFGRITLLKNNAGMYLIQRVRQECEGALGRPVSWGEMVVMAEQASKRCVFDVNDSQFFNPASMSAAIWGALTQTGQVQGEVDWPTMILSVYLSLAESYALCVQNLEKVTGKQFARLYIVGGGSRNDLLNHLTAERTGRTVIACDGESTVLGNIAAQIAYFEPEQTPETLRAVVARSVDARIFECNA